jgi:capsular polysaccharide export protein
MTLQDNSCTYRQRRRRDEAMHAPRNHPLKMARTRDRLRLAFIDPGLRRAPFFLELRHVLPPHIECLYWSPRPIVRSYMRSAGVDIHPATRRARTPEFDISDADLRDAVGAKELALRPVRALRRARALLSRLAEFIDGEQVDAIVVWNGSNLPLALAIYLARQRGLPVVHAENGYLPGTTQVDLDGVNFNASITRLVNSGEAWLPPHPDLDAMLDADIARFKSGRRMPDLQPLPSPDLCRNFAARFASRALSWLKDRALPRLHRVSLRSAVARELPARYVLLPFQVRGDSQLVLHSPLYGNDLEAVVGELDAALARIDPSLRLVAKFHPQELPNVQRGYRGLSRRFPRVSFVNEVPMRKLLEGASAVVTINSTAGFEALLYDKPVLALGRNFYTVPGIVDCLAHRDGLETALRSSLASTPDRERRRAFLRFVRARFLVACGCNDFSARSLRGFGTRVADLLAAAAVPAALPPRAEEAA